MGLLNDLQAAALEQRKAAVKGEGGEHATFLAMVLSDIYAVAKRDQRAATDQDAEPLMRTYVKQQNALLDGTPATDTNPELPPLPEGDYRQQVIAKRDALLAILPQLLEGQPLFDAIREVADAAGVPPLSKSMGAVMKGLNAAYPGRVSGALVKDALDNGKV